MQAFNQHRTKLLNMIGLNREITVAKGHYLTDADGNQMLDCIAQFGAVPFGHNPDFLCDAVSDYVQSSKANFVQPFFSPDTKTLTEKLCRLAGKAYSFVALTNSGAETVEAGIKLARLKTGRKAILSAENSFHGKTFSALSATGSDKYSNDLIVDEQGYNKVPFNDITALSQALESKAYAAFIVEPIQGEGGMIEASDAYLKAAAELCKKTGTLLIADEIQTGIGRTGKLFACQHYDIEPDVLLLSKALGGGMSPIGAMVVKKSAYSKVFDKKHSSTFANGGLACHVANKVLDKLSDDSTILASVNEKSAYISAEFANLQREFSGFFSYSGTGLMYALRLHDNVTKDNYLVNYLLKSGGLSYLIAGYLATEENVLMVPFLSDGCAIRFEPSLTIEMDELKRLVKAIRRVCAMMRHARYDLLFKYLVGESANGESPETPSYRKPVFFAKKAPKNNKRFAFLMHTTSLIDFVRGLPLAIRENYSQEQQEALSNWMMALGKIDYTPASAVEVQMKSEQGDTVDGMMIFSPIKAQDMMRLSADEKSELLDGYLEVAKDANIDVIGLGAYTSVISRAGEDIIKRPEAKHFTFSTGNSFTALSTSKAIQMNYGQHCITKNVAVIGARGSVGRLASIDLACHVNQVFLIGNPRSGEGVINDCCIAILAELLASNVEHNVASAYGQFLKLLKLANMTKEYALQQLNNQSRQFLQRLTVVSAELQLDFPIKTSVNIEDFIEQSDCVLSATSEGKAFINAEIFKPGTQIFDASRPFDFVCDDDALIDIHEGGLVSQPQAVSFGDCNMIGTKPGINLACLSETVALAMESVEQNYSIGKKIPYLEAKEVYRIASSHGFKPYLAQNKQWAVASSF